MTCANVLEQMVFSIERLGLADAGALWTCVCGQSLVCRNMSDICISPRVPLATVYFWTDVGLVSCTLGVLFESV